MSERGQVPDGLPARDPPGVLLADRRREAELQQGVEGAVRVLHDRAQQPVDLLGRHRGQRQPPSWFSSGRRTTKALSERVWRPTISWQVVDSLRVPGSWVTYVPGVGDSQGNSAS